MKSNEQRDKIRAGIREGLRQMALAEQNGNDRLMLGLAAFIEHWARELKRHAEEHGFT